MPVTNILGGLRVVLPSFTAQVNTNRPIAKIMPTDEELRSALYESGVKHEINPERITEARKLLHGHVIGQRLGRAFGHLGQFVNKPTSEEVKIIPPKSMRRYMASFRTSLVMKTNLYIHSLPDGDRRSAALDRFIEKTLNGNFGQGLRQKGIVPDLIFLTIISEMIDVGTFTDDSVFKPRRFEGVFGEFESNKKNIMDSPFGEALIAYYERTDQLDEMIEIIRTEIERPQDIISQFDSEISNRLTQMEMNALKRIGQDFLKMFDILDIKPIRGILEDAQK